MSKLLNKIILIIIVITLIPIINKVIKPAYTTTTTELIVTEHELSFTGNNDVVQITNVKLDGEDFILTGSSFYNLFTYDGDGIATNIISMNTPLVVGSTEVYGSIYVDGDGVINYSYTDIDNNPTFTFDLIQVSITSSTEITTFSYTVPVSNPFKNMDYSIIFTSSVEGTVINENLILKNILILVPLILSASLIGYLSLSVKKGDE